MGSPLGSQLSSVLEGAEEMAPFVGELAGLSLSQLRPRHSPRVPQGCGRNSRVSRVDPA